MATVFLSYRHKGDNAQRVRAFADRLEAAGLTIRAEAGVFWRRPESGLAALEQAL